MKAKFATSCVSCGGKIQPGKEISKNKDKTGFISTVLRIWKACLRN